MKPGKHQRSKQRRQDLCWKVHNPAQSLCMNYVPSMFLLVSPSVWIKGQHCFSEKERVYNLLSGVSRISTPWGI